MDSIYIDTPTLPGRPCDVVVSSEIAWGDTCSMYSALTSKEARIVARAAIEVAEAVEYDAAHAKDSFRILVIESENTAEIHGDAVAFTALTGLAADMLRRRKVDAVPEIVFSRTEEDNPSYPPDISHCIAVSI